MEPITLTAISVFLTPYLKKAGEKIAEKTVESLFNSHEAIAEKFRGLFNDEITTLNLNDSTSTGEIKGRLEQNPQIIEEINRKIAENKNLLDELIEKFKEMSQPEFAGVSINAEKIAQININPQQVTQNIENF